MKQLFTFIVMLFLASMLYAQKLITGCPKVLFSSAQVTDSTCDSGIKDVGLSFNRAKVTIKYKDKSKKIFSADSVWGLRYKNDYPYRLYKEGLYLLYEVGSIYKYSRRTGRYGQNYFFSNSLDSAIYPYDEMHLRKYADSATYATIVKDAETNRHELAFDLYAVNTRMLNKSFWGGGIDVKYFPKKKWATGLSLVYLGGKSADTFNFSIKEPFVTYLEFGWVNQYDFINNGTMRANININNGMAWAELRDNGERTPTRTRYGYKNVPKLLASNYYYLLVPGLDFFFRFFSNKHDPDFYLTAKMKYRQVFGNSKFASEDLFSGFSATIGLSVIGFDKMQFSK